MSTCSVIGILLSIVCLSSIAEAQEVKTSEEKEILVIMRYDDYGNGSSTDLEMRLIKAFQERSIPCVFGVIPFSVAQDRDFVPLDMAKVEILKDASMSHTIEVAMHGFTHQKLSSVQTEFKGFDYVSQRLRIEKGKKSLEELLGREISNFIPPFNTFDSNTIVALEDLEFEVFSSSIDEEFDVRPTSRLKFFPSTTSLLKVETAIESARQIADVQPIIIVLFHSYDFAEDESREKGKLTIPKFVQMLDWLVAQEDVRIVSMSEAATIVDDLSAARFINFVDRFILRLAPPVLENQSSVPVGVYYSSIAQSARIGIWAKVIAFYLAIALCACAVAYVVGSLVLTRVRYLNAIATYGSIALFVSFFVYDLRNMVISYTGALVLALLFGSFCGTLICQQRTKSKPVSA